MSVIGFSNGLTKEQSIEKFKKQFDAEYQKKVQNNYYSALWNLHSSRTEYLDNILDKLFQNFDRIGFESKTNTDITFEIYEEEYNKVQKFLQEYNYEVTDYIGGIARKVKRNFKIGKLLERHAAPAELIKMFSNSVYRTNAKKNNIFTLSRNVYDILTMSTFRGWSSCMGIPRDNFSHVIADIQYGTLIIYNHSPFDTDIEKPSGRFLLKPYICEVDGKTSIFYKREDTRYGEMDSCWRDIGDEIEKYVNDILVDDSALISGFLPVGIYRDDISSSASIINFEKLDPATADFKSDYHMARKYMEYLPCHDIAINNPNLVDYVEIHKLTSISLLSNLDYSSINNILENNNIRSNYKKLIGNMDISKINIRNSIRIISCMAEEEDNDEVIEEAILKYMEENLKSRLIVSSIIKVEPLNKRIKELIDLSFIESNYYIINIIFRNIRIDKSSYIYKLIQDKINQTVDLNLYGLVRQHFDKDYFDVDFKPVYILYEFSKMEHPTEIGDMLSKHFDIPRDQLSKVSSELRNIIRANNFIGKDYKVMIDDQIFEIKGDI